jgi:hypothetical protein
MLNGTLSVGSGMSNGTFRIKRYKMLCVVDAVHSTLETFAKTLDSLIPVPHFNGYQLVDDVSIQLLVQLDRNIGKVT